MRPPSLPGFVPLLLSLCLMASGTASAQITIDFTSPQSELIPKDFELKVNISSENQLASVQAEFGGKVTPMPVRPQSSLPLSIAGLPYGTYELTVTVRDVFGRQTKASRSLQVDRPPRLVVQEPLWGGVARPSAHLLASCEDDGPEGCEILVQAYAVDPFKLYNSRDRELLPIELTASSVMDQEVCLAEHVGKQVFFNFHVSDGRQNGDRVERFVLVNDDANLIQVASVPGRLLDFDAQRLLFIDEQQRARVMDRTTGGIETLLENLAPYNNNLQQNCRVGVLACSLGDDYGRLVPGGVFFADTSYSAILIKDGQRLTLGKFSYDPKNRYNPQYSIAGRLLTFDRMIHDVVAGTVRSVNALTWLDRNGSHLWYDRSNYNDTYSLMRDRNGQTALLIKAKDMSHPRSDGDDVIVNIGKTVVLLHGGQQEVLADNSNLSVPAGPSLVKEDRVAFIREGGGVAQVWTRSAAGLEQQVSFSGRDSRPILLQADGTTVYESNSRYYLAVPGAPHVTFSRVPERFLAVENGVAYVALNNTLFQVDPTAAREPLTCPAVTPPPEQPPGPVGCGCSAADGGSAWLLLLALLRLVRTGAHAYVQRRHSTP